MSTFLRRAWQDAGVSAACEQDPLFLAETAAHDGSAQGRVNLRLRFGDANEGIELP